MPLEIPMRKWEHVAIDFVVELPMQDKCDTICTVVDKATKMCHFIPCSENDYQQNKLHNCIGSMWVSYMEFLAY